MAYKPGAYGEITESKVERATQADVVAGYIGTAPVNLIRGWASADLVNVPIKISNMGDAQSKLGYAGDWGKFTLCEAFAQHFDNTVQNIGPIYVVNVLDPATHKKAQPTTKQLTLANKRAEFESTTIILDSFAIEDKVEGTDYTLAYNFAKGTVILTWIGASAPASVSATFSEVDPSAVAAADIIGNQTAAGVYTGLFAFKLLYQYFGAVLNILAAPGWSDQPSVYAAMVATVTKLNGHWDGFVNADIPLMNGGTAIATIAQAIAWKGDNGYTAENSKVYWPQVKDGSGRVFHLSTVATATMLATDLGNESVPFESPSNKEIMATAQYFGATSTNRGFDQDTANSLNEQGITTACFWASRWVLWGPHTAAYAFNGNMDARAVFDCNIRMLMHITNGFQLDHGTEIDQPMTPQDRDAILSAERERLDTLKGIGALIGEPVVEFVEAENPLSNMVNGDFTWHFNVTNTPPFKSATGRVTYTDEGFQAFYEGE